MRLTSNCPICNRSLIRTATYRFDTCVLEEYKCGHIFSQEIGQKKPLKLKSVFGEKEARHYQEEGVDFVVNGAEGNEQGYNCLLSYQQRLGKTPTSLLALASDYDNRTPCLILVRSANLWQWIREYKVWCDALPNGIYPIIGSKTTIFPGFKTYIMSMDTFSRKGVVDQLLKIGIKLVIVDEAHSFKNTDSKRSQALVQFLKEINTSELEVQHKFVCFSCQFEYHETLKISVHDGDKYTRKQTFCPKCGAQQSFAGLKENILKDQHKVRKCGLVLLTGTPIKNRADEYFVPLNLLAPDLFPSFESFKRRWLVQDANGRYSRIHPNALDSFKRVIAPFVLRKEKEDVYTDLPPINRMFTVVEIDDDNLKKAYNTVLDNLEHAVEIGQGSFFQTIGELSLLRQICGLAKVQYVTDTLLEMKEEMNGTFPKHAVGIHHHGVRDLLAHKCSTLRPMTLSGQDNAYEKDRIMREFETNDSQLLILNMLAGGVGMDFHYCHEVLVLERQWSSADEEQFEFRFYNPDRSIMGDNSTNIEYIIAKGTVDEFFYDLVEDKRRIFGDTISNNWDLSQDGGSYKALLEKTIGGRL